MNIPSLISAIVAHIHHKSKPNGYKATNEDAALDSWQHLDVLK